MASTLFKNIVAMRRLKASVATILAIESQPLGRNRIVARLATPCEEKKSNCHPWMRPAAIPSTYSWMRPEITNVARIPRAWVAARGKAAKCVFLKELLRGLVPTSPKLGRRPGSGKLPHGVEGLTAEQPPEDRSAVRGEPNCQDILRFTGEVKQCPAPSLKSNVPDAGNPRQPLRRWRP